ncbi:hypothetical protein C2E25_05560 [Geothermobacter hydrogeniphilus]|uniref:FixH protein n=2 Tax=Geothermobacter hydrogeniphilus TaxID=1969733 RepID=A0A2K2HC84_9BACT|nr:hypothetical protein C2E25_05560 [Geothermobacter hydrogeniphilus]
MMNTLRNRIAPLLICLLIAVFVLFLIWSWQRAATLGTRVSDRDYYSKGLKYNHTLIEKRAAKTLGWTVSADLQSRLLRLELRDGNNRSVAGAKGLLRLSRHTEQAENFNLDEISPGNYQLQLPAGLAGELRAQIEFEHDGALLTRQLLLNL